jgi:hypothetical protein
MQAGKSQIGEMKDATRNFVLMYGVLNCIHMLFPEIENWRQTPEKYFRDESKGGFITEIHRKSNEFRNPHMLIANSDGAEGGLSLPRFSGRPPAGRFSKQN